MPSRESVTPFPDGATFSGGAAKIADGIVRTSSITPQSRIQFSLVIFIQGRRLDPGFLIAASSSSQLTNNGKILDAIFQTC